MRKSVLAAIMASTFAMAGVVEACSSSDGGGSSGPVDPGNEAGSSSGSSGSSGTSGGPGEDGGDASTDSAKQDGATDLDGALPDEGGSMDPPSVRMVGRFVTNGAISSFAYPGSKLIARFMGTDATVKLTQHDGFSSASSGHSWFNIKVDGVLQAPFEVSATTSTDYPVATNLAAGIHTVELEKRTEGNLGVVDYGGFTFGNGGTLLSPPARPAHRIEFLSDSTIDGFGIEGRRPDAVPPPAAADSCGSGAPAKFDNSAKSMSEVAAASLTAESFLIAYSGKGITTNGSNDTLYFPALYGRTLPDTAGSTWDFTSWIPDVVVVSLGGTDFDTPKGQPVVTPPTFNATYGAMVDTIRTNYPNAWIFLTVWSQIKDDNAPVRTAMTNSLNAVVAARAADTKLSVYAFPQANVDTDETGCEYHGNVAHHAAMAAKLVTEIQAKVPGW